MTDTDHFDRLAETYSTQADYCRHMAEEQGDAFDEPWVLLAAAWTELAEETKARSRGSRPSSRRWAAECARNSPHALALLDSRAAHRVLRTFLDRRASGGRLS